MKKSKAWFQKSTNYWQGQEATVNGMLGGLGALSPIDLEGSSAFLSQWYLRDSPTDTLAMDVGAGIGRVSQGLLLKHFAKVSLLEASPEFLAKAQESLPPARLHRLFQCRFGDWICDEESIGAYDLIWIQWVIIYASDEELVEFLLQAQKALKPGGMIGLKDNILMGTKKDTAAEYDEQDHSVCRAAGHLERLFDEAGLRLVTRKQQDRMPAHLYPVYMYMLTPKV